MTEQDQARIAAIEKDLNTLINVLKDEMGTNDGVSRFGIKWDRFSPPIAPVEETKHPLDNLSQGAGYVLGKIAVEEKVEKPPLGIIPCKLWIEDRLIALNEAMERYEGTPYGIPVDWIEEAAWLQKEYNTKYPVNTIAQTEPIKEERWNVSVQPFKYNINDNRIIIYYNDGNLTSHEAHKISDKIKQLLKEL